MAIDDGTRSIHNVSAKPTLTCTVHALRFIHSGAFILYVPHRNIGHFGKTISDLRSNFLVLIFVEVFQAFLLLPEMKDVIVLVKHISLSILNELAICKM